MLPHRIFDAAWNQLDSDDSAAGYAELPPWPQEMRVSGSLRQWQRTVFEGAELIGVLWRSESGTVRIDHYPYDQTVVVLRGHLSLTEAGGQARHFEPGDTFLLPRGFKCLWTMEDGEYEEFIVVERATFLHQESEAPPA